MRWWTSRGPRTTGPSPYTRRSAARRSARAWAAARRTPSRRPRSRRSTRCPRKASHGDGAGERRDGTMYLKSITVRGFKSFPDRTRLEFGPGVSVIVGPNGSGKSHVTDAGLWALVVQSMVAFRDASIAEEIFGDAPGRPAHHRHDVAGMPDA